MVYHERSSIFRIYDRRPLAASLIQHDDVFGTLLFHSPPLGLVVNVVALAQQVHVDEIGVKAQGRQGALDDDARAEPVGILVWDYQRLLVGSGAAKTISSLTTAR